MTLNTFQKNLLFTVGVAILLGLVGVGGYLGVSGFRNYREQRRIADCKARVQRVMALNRCTHLSEPERARLDKVASDPQETKKVLLEIHNERFFTWNNASDAAKRRCDSLWKARNMPGIQPVMTQAMSEYKMACDQLSVFA